jgi:carbonyl reductase 1
MGSDNAVENARKCIETNYYGTKRMIEAMIPLMKPSAAGARIVNVSSRLGRVNGKRNVSKLSIYVVSLSNSYSCN